jgi:hypothetical protein
MAFTTPALGGTTMPQCSEYRYQRGYRGGAVRLGSGTVAYDLVTATVKRTFELSWRNVSEANRDTINTAYATVASASASLTTPDGVTATVMRAEDQPTLEWSAVAKSGSVFLWSTTMRLEEV